MNDNLDAIKKLSIAEIARENVSTDPNWHEKLSDPKPKPYQRKVKKDEANQKANNNYKKK